MTPRTISYFKIFGLFLLRVAAITFVIVVARQYLSHSDFYSSIIDFILRVIMMMGYLWSWMQLRGRLKDIEKH